MSTSAHDPIPTGVLAASDPAELLAFVRIRLAQEARDELVLVGCDGYDLGLTCSLALEDLLGPAPSCDLATTLAGMAGTGVDMVFAL
ncbi:MAG: hypothetical protein Q4G40_02890, partial [Brachybacterium sp.]|nr:hypothetical protein [Brachybacterium sp.]